MDRKSVHKKNNVDIEKQELLSSLEEEYKMVQAKKHLYISRKTIIQE